jgi:murein DD-endopeptidase MepM/ murein hydrolase activator NlpD
MKRTPRLLVALTLFCALASTATALYHTVLPAPQLPQPLVPEFEEAPVIEELPIQPGDTLQAVVHRAALDESLESPLVQAIAAAVDPRTLRAGTAFTITRTALGEPRALEYALDKEHLLRVSFPQEGQATPLSAQVDVIPGVTQTVPICATLQRSLFESIDAAGESPELAMRIADLFAWDLDFYTDPQNGDEFCLLIEKRTYQNGQSPSYGKILAASYNNAGTVHDAFLFPDADGKSVYYSSDGKSTQSAFLRSPLKFAARISSRFSHSRFHPVLKIRRPHLGIDYAAPTGTPVQAVAAGTVTFSARSGGAGNLIKLRHANGFETYYMHLSRLQVRAGQKVNQGQQIGLVGSTGLSTGPHLDFRIRKNGRYLNFEKLELPRESFVPPARLPAFHQQRREFLAQITNHPDSQGAVLAQSTTLNQPGEATTANP